MKNLTTLLAFLVSSAFTHATIHTVDNTLDAGAQFSSISSAISAASAGDTILVHPSDNNYGNISINKHVHLVGPGFNPEISDGLTAQMNAVTLTNGSDGTIIEGFRIANIQGALFAQSSNIQIRHNLITSSTAIASTFGDNSNSDTWIIEGNLIIDQGGCGGCKLISVDASAGGSDNWIIRNNIIQIASGSNRMFTKVNASTSILNNLIIHRSTNLVFDDSNDAIIANNIFYANNGVNDMTAECSGCLFSNNLFYTNNNDHVDVAGNIVNQDPLFEELVSGTPVYDGANDYHLQSGSPAEGTGEAGTDMGIYGAGYNFRTRGYPNSHPRMTSVVPSFIAVPAGETFDVEIEAVRAGQ